MKNHTVSSRSFRPGLRISRPMSSSDHALQAYVRRKMPCRPTYRQVDPNARAAGEKAAKPWLDASSEPWIEKEATDNGAFYQSPHRRAAVTVCYPLFGIPRPRTGPIMPASGIIRSTATSRRARIPSYRRQGRRRSSGHSGDHLKWSRCTKRYAQPVLSFACARLLKPTPATAWKKPPCHWPTV